MARAAELGRLSGVVAELDRQAAQVRSALADQREAAFQRLLELRAADEAAEQAAERVVVARAETAAAGSSIDLAQQRLDAFATSTYQQNLDLGPLGLLTSASSPADLVAMAEFGELIARDRFRALKALQRANTACVNAESTARATEEDAMNRKAAAGRVRVVADDAVTATAAAVAE